MKVYAWRWGLRIWLCGHSVCLLGPHDSPSFSERNGYRKPALKLGGWRIFVKKSKYNGTVIEGY